MHTCVRLSRAIKQKHSVAPLYQSLPPRAKLARDKPVDDPFFVKAAASQKSTKLTLYTEPKN